MRDPGRRQSSYTPTAHKATRASNVKPPQEVSKQCQAMVIMILMNGDDVKDSEDNDEVVEVADNDGEDDE